MAHSTAARCFGVSPRQSVPRSTRRVAHVVRAKTEENESEALPKFFQSNQLASRGYLEEDSAGQQNVFAVQPKKYVQGSDMDETTGAAGNTFFGVAGAALGLVVIAAGTSALFVQSAQTEASSQSSADFSGLATLSEYKAKFASDLKTTASVEAPSIAPEV